MDYPAAHSMDTDWFAVDDEGRIALLASGEAGPVPERIGEPMYWDEVVTPIARDIAKFAVKHGILAAGKHAPGPWESGTLLCLSAAQDTVELLICYSGADQRHAEGLCKGCCRLEDVFILYECDDYDGLVYTRTANPERAITMQDVGSPEVLQAGRIAGTDFAAMSTFQPIQHEPCMTWGDYETMTAEDGTTVPVPEHSRQAGMKEPAAAPPKTAAARGTRDEPKKPWWKFW